MKTSITLFEVCVMKDETKDETVLTFADENCAQRYMEFMQACNPNQKWFVCHPRTADDVIGRFLDFMDKNNLTESVIQKNRDKNK
jgi:hypothetical protein